VVLSPYDRGLVGDVFGDSASFMPEEVPADLRHIAVRAREDGSPPGLRGFKDTDTVSSVLGVRGLFPFGDSLKGSKD
jgi:hypothetical protein